MQISKGIYNEETLCVDALTKYPICCWKGSGVQLFYLLPLDGAKSETIYRALIFYKVVKGLVFFAANMICDQYSHSQYSILIRCIFSQSFNDQYV